MGTLDSDPGIRPHSARMPVAVGISTSSSRLPRPRQGRAVGGVDLGLHHLAALSDGRKIKMPAFYRRHEKQLALAQQLGQKMTRNCVACQSEKLQATLPA